MKLKIYFRFVLYLRFPGYFGQRWLHNHPLKKNKITQFSKISIQFFSVFSVYNLFFLYLEPMFLSSQNKKNLHTNSPQIFSHQLIKHLLKPKANFFLFFCSLFPSLLSSLSFGLWRLLHCLLLLSFSHLRKRPNKQRQQS